MNRIWVPLACALIATPAFADVTSVQSGAWQSSTTWGGQPIPDAADHVTIADGTTVTLSTAQQALGILVEEGGTLAFSAADDASLEVSENVVVYGTLEMGPTDAAETHVLRFIDVDEGAFIGGHTTSPIASDVGLWCFDTCVLDLVGVQKTGWTRLAGGVEAGATTIELESVPVGWRAGDTIVIAPTEHPSVGSRFYTGFEERSIQAKLDEPSFELFDVELKQPWGSPDG